MGPIVRAAEAAMAELLVEGRGGTTSMTDGRSDPASLQHIIKAARVLDPSLLHVAARLIPLRPAVESAGALRMAAILPRPRPDNHHHNRMRTQAYVGHSGQPQSVLANQIACRLEKDTDLDDDDGECESEDADGDGEEEEEADERNRRRERKRRVERKRRREEDSLLDEGEGEAINDQEEHEHLEMSTHGSVSAMALRRGSKQRQAYHPNSTSNLPQKGTNSCRGNKDSHQDLEGNPDAQRLMRPQYTGCRYDLAKPPYSYASLIAQALLATPTRRLTLNQIYAWIMEQYPYYRSENSGWQNSIRHNLSLNSCFIKLPKMEGDYGKGAYWTINEEELTSFRDGAFKRRKMGASLNGNCGWSRRRRRSRLLTECSGDSISLEAITISGGEKSKWSLSHSRISTARHHQQAGTIGRDRIALVCPPIRANDPQINGSFAGLRLEDIHRASSPSQQPIITHSINHACEMDMACPELAETCITFNTWEWQAGTTDLCSDLADQIELLAKA